MNITIPAAATEEEDAVAQELMSRLASQFGDLDLTKLVEDATGNSAVNGTGDDDDASEESSLAEPTPEELREWQAAQFQKGQAKLEAKKRSTLTPLQRRRLDRREQLIKQLKENGTNNGANMTSEELLSNEEWEEVYPPPDLQGEKSIFFSSHNADDGELLGGVHLMLHQLANGDPEILGTAWKCLYSSDNGDGLSFPQLLTAVKGYDGPTVTIYGTIPSQQQEQAASEKMRTIGMYTATPWQESTDLFGTSDCFLFSLDHEDNKVSIFRPQPKLHEVSGDDKNRYMYCHTSFAQNVSVKTSGVAAGTTTSRNYNKHHGIGMGGTTVQPRVHITESLENCRALTYCGVFEEGDILGPAGLGSLYYFDVDAIEVWGVGGVDWIQHALEKQQHDREVAHANQIRAHTVKDKRQFIDDFKSGLLGDGKTALFEHVHHVAGRTGC